MYGDDYEYASSRLAGTIVRLGAEPIIIDDVYPDLNVIAAKLTDIKTFFKAKLSDLNLKPVELGFANYKGNASYLTRRPMRRDWKQGLRLGNFISLSGWDAGMIPPDVLSQVILNQYPTFDECKGMVKSGKGAATIAWHRHWALSSHGVVIYKGTTQVGQLSKGGEIVLSDDYLHLREYLQECV